MSHFTFASLIIKGNLTAYSQLAEPNRTEHEPNASKPNHYFASNPLLDEFYESYIALKCHF